LASKPLPFFRLRQCTGPTPRQKIVNDSYATFSFAVQQSSKLPAGTSTVPAACQVKVDPPFDQV
jgi:hypothetical protein